MRTTTPSHSGTFRIRILCSTPLAATTAGTFQTACWTTPRASWCSPMAALTSACPYYTSLFDPSCREGANIKALARQHLLSVTKFPLGLRCMSQVPVHIIMSIPLHHLSPNRPCESCIQGTRTKRSLTCPAMQPCKAQHKLPAQASMELGLVAIMMISVTMSCSRLDGRMVVHGLLFACTDMSVSV